MRKLILLLIFISFVSNLYSCATKRPSKEEAEKTAQYYFQMGVSYLNSGNVAEAIYNLNQAYNLKPKDPDILNALGIAYTKVGELDKAQEYFLKAIEIAPDKPESYVNLGIVLAQKKDYGSAEKYFKKAIENPNYKNKEKAYYNLALVYLKLGNLNKYEESLKKAIAYDNFFLPAYEELGKYYMQQERYNDAQKIYETAVSLGLGSPDIYYNLGLIFYKKKNYSLAKYYLKKGLVLSEDNKDKKFQIQRLLNKINEEETENLKKTSLKIENTEKQTEKKIIIIPKEETKTPPSASTETSVKKEENNLNLPFIAKKTYPEEKKKSVIRFYINLGTFSSEEDAKKLHAKLKLYGYDSTIEKINIDGNTFYIVYIGYFDDYLKASRFYKQNLKPIGFRGIIKFKRVEISGEEKG
jgi:type IV pilus assembly protein PilF